jgi:hypothetical protein
MAKRHEDDIDDGLAKLAANWSVGGWVLPAFWLAVAVLAVAFAWFWR